MAAIRNTPYVRQYDQNGTLLNPILKGQPYYHEHRNRAQRRYKEPNYSVGMTVLSRARFMRFRQQVPVYIGKGKDRVFSHFKWIQHYIEVKVNWGMGKMLRNNKN